MSARLAAVLWETLLPSGSKGHPEKRSRAEERHLLSAPCNSNIVVSRTQLSPAAACTAANESARAFATIPNDIISTTWNRDPLTRWLRCTAVAAVLYKRSRIWMATRGTHIGLSRTLYTSGKDRRQNISIDCSSIRAWWTRRRWEILRCSRLLSSCLGGLPDGGGGISTSCTLPNAIAIRRTADVF